MMNDAQQAGSGAWLSSAAVVKLIVVVIMT
jgi:hypothetical protein